MLPVAANDLLQTRPEASLFGGDGGFNSQDDFLPVEQAFRLEKKRVDSQNIHLQFIIADGYYLYKDRFSFKSDNPKVTIAPPVLAKGQIQHDEFFGDVEVYHAVLDIVLPVTNPDKLAFNFELKYQGCAEKGLCYPMETINIPVSGIVEPKTSDVSAEKPAILSFSDSLQALSWKTLFSYFVIGLGLALTPCVFPMLPILSGIVLRGETGRIRAQFLALAYILAMAITYAVLGVLVGLFGAKFNLQAKMQSAWILVPFAIFFIIFALAMFGLFELRLPSFITSSMNKAADRTHGGSLFGAAVLGICSSLVISPCVTAPFAGILFHISSTGDAVGGGATLFALGLGMGAPLYLIAAGGGALLPKAGHWMIIVRNIFGVMLLGVAILLISRVLPGYVSLLLWGALAAGVAVFMGTLNFYQEKTKVQKLAQVFGLFLFIYAFSAWVGGLQGNSDPLQPLKKQAVIVSQGVMNTAGWQTVTTKAELNQLLLEAQKVEKPVILDWSASWCTSCLIMERDVFHDAEVISKLTGYQLIKFDISANTAEQMALLDQYGIVGPPAILFFDKVGNELKTSRIVSEKNKEQFLTHLKAITL